MSSFAFDITFFPFTSMLSLEALQKRSCGGQMLHQLGTLSSINQEARWQKWSLLFEGKRMSWKQCLVKQVVLKAKPRTWKQWVKVAFGTRSTACNADIRFVTRIIELVLSVVLLGDHTALPKIWFWSPKPPLHQCRFKTWGRKRARQRSGASFIYY